MESCTMIEWDLAQGGNAKTICSTPPNFEKACPPWASAPSRRRRRRPAPNIGKKMQKNALKKCVIIHHRTFGFRRVIDRQPHTNPKLCY